MDPSSSSSQPVPTAVDTADPPGGSFPIVGLGASAGGLQALSELLDHLPPDTGMAFVVVMHLAPEHESRIAELLQQHTAMPVMQVTQSVTLLADNVYVIPPARDLAMSDGTVGLTDPAPEGGRRVPIDHFLRTLADTHGRRTAAVILSGSGSDGAIGLKRIKEAGGLTLAQDPLEAGFAGMPESAIGTGLVDFILPVAAMPDALITFWQRSRTINSEMADRGGAALRDILALLKARTGHDFSQYKRPSVLRRLGRRMQITGADDLAAYLTVLRGRSDEVQALLQDLLISVTNFFRDSAAWSAFEATLPQLFANKAPGAAVRVWVAGCATGEEAYSVAMLLAEHARRREDSVVIQVFATDIDTTALASARLGVYPDTIALDVSADRLRRFFTVEPGAYHITQELRDMVLFAPHNLLRDPPFSKLDAITCRNLLIYLNRESQRQVISTFHFSLRSDGVLLLGSSESLDGAPALFTTLDKGQRLFQRSSVALPESLGSALPPAAERTPVVGSRARDATINSFGELHRQLLAEHLPPSVIVNEAGEIVHLARGVSRFLSFEEGEPSHQLLRVVHPDLRLELRTAFFAAQQEQSVVETRNIGVMLDDVARRVDLLVQPIAEPDWARGYMLVLFSEVNPVADAPAATGTADDALLGRLEAELERTKDQLRSTVEQYETAGEEYKAANEELQAINEELRATGEELETSKEELQSLNEELHTLNQELRHRVDEVSRSNSDLQNLIAATQIGTLFLDLQLRITRYTPSLVGLFNLIPTDIQRPFAHLTHTLLYDGLAEDARQVLATLASLEREIESVAGRWYLARMLPYRTLDDGIGGVVLTLVDISDSKRAQAADAYLAEIVAASGDAIVGIGTGGMIESWNPTAQSVFGHTAAEAIGQPIGLLAVPEHNVEQDELIAQVQAGRSVRQEAVYQTKDGRAIDVRLSVAPVVDVNGRNVGISAILTDITARKQAEAERERLLAATQQARREAEAALEVRDQFLSIASHEVRTPLTTILGYADVMQRKLKVGTVPRAQQERMVGLIVRQAKRLSVLMGQLFDATRIEHGQFELERSPLDFGALVAGVTGEFQLTLATDETAPPIQLDNAAKGLIVDGDADRLEQVLLNMLNNAVKYNQARKPIAVRVSRAGAQAVLEVADQGIGIPAAAQAHLFESFFRADNVGPISGFGIGLHVVANIVQRHDGRIEVESTEGQGSTFRVILPLADPQP